MIDVILVNYVCNILSINCYLQFIFHILCKELLIRLYLSFLIFFSFITYSDQLSKKHKMYIYIRNNSFISCLAMGSFTCNFIIIQHSNTINFTIQHEKAHIIFCHSQIYTFVYFIICLKLNIYLTLIIISVYLYIGINLCEIFADLYSINNCSKTELIQALSEIKDYDRDIFHPTPKNRTHLIKQHLI